GVVEVTAGAEASRIDIRLGQPSQTYQASGRIVDDAGKPVPNVMVSCGSVGGTGSYRPPDPTLHSNMKGEFKIEGLVTGHYSASATFVHDQGLDLYSDATSFEVKSSDVTGLEIRVHKGLSISGVAVVEGTDDPAASAGLSTLELWATDVPFEGGGSGVSRSKIQPDNSFRLVGLHPGRV